MENNEKVKEDNIHEKKIAEAIEALTNLVKETGGCLMVIGTYPVGKSTGVAATLYGKPSDMTEAAARVIVQPSGAPFRRVFKNAMTTREILRLTGTDNGDVMEVVRCEDHNKYDESEDENNDDETAE